MTQISQEPRQKRFVIRSVNDVKSGMRIQCVNVIDTGRMTVILEGTVEGIPYRSPQLLERSPAGEPDTIYINIRRGTYRSGVRGHTEVPTSFLGIGSNASDERTSYQIVR